MSSKEENSSRNPLPMDPSLFEFHWGSLKPQREQWALSKSPPPVLLLSGPRGCGKRSFAHALLQWFNCEKSPFADHSNSDANLEMGLLGESELMPSTPRLEACQECPSCKRTLSGQWLDFLEIASEDQAKSGSIKLAQLDAVKSKLGFGAHGSGFRIFLLNRAHELTTQAANSLLKILEEPPQRWLFLMTTSDTSLMLPTLLSRSQTIRLRPIANSVIAQILKSKGVADERAKVAFGLAQGSLSRALLFTDDKHSADPVRIRRFIESPGYELQSMVEWASQENSHFDFMLDSLEESVLTSLQNNNDRSPLQRKFLLECADLISDTRMKMQAPLNRKILAQEILSQWLSPYSKL